MSETLLTDIDVTIKSFEHTLEATQMGRRDHVGASADLRAVGPSVRAGEGARRRGAVSVRGQRRADGREGNPGAGGETPTEVRRRSLPIPYAKRGAVGGRSSIAPSALWTTPAALWCVQESRVLESRDPW